MKPIGEFETFRHQVNRRDDSLIVFQANVGQSDEEQKRPSYVCGTKAVDTLQNSTSFEEDGFRDPNLLGCEDRIRDRRLLFVVLSQKPNDQVSIGRCHNGF